MSGRTPAAQSTPTHPPSTPAAGGVRTRGGRGARPPPVAAVLPRDPSPASTIGLSSAAPAASLQTPRRSVLQQSVEESVASVSQYGRSVTRGGESPAVLGGASLPPPSPAKQAGFAVEAVGIPTSKPARKIANTDESKFEQGYDSDGEIGPFMDAVANQTTIDIEDEDADLPATMLGGGTADGAPAVAPAAGARRKPNRKPKKKKKRGKGKRKKAKASNEREELAVGDRVEAHYTYDDGKTRDWLEATVVNVHEPGEGTGRTYDVEYFDGEPQLEMNEEDIRMFGTNGKEEESSMDEEDLASSSEEEEEEGNADEPGDDTPMGGGERPDWFMSKDDINALGVTELKAEIKKRGLVPKGKKTDLQDMLHQCMAKEMPIVAMTAKEMQVLSGFPVGSKWTTLEPSAEEVIDPANEFFMHAPTDDPDFLPLNPKQKFDEEWDRPVFNGRDKEGRVRLKGHPRGDFIRDERLTVNSHPVEWLDAFLPVYDRPKRSKSRTPHHLSVDKMCKWSNEKAALMQMGTKTLYPSFKPFTTEEFEQYLYLFFWNGLNPSPQIEWKLQTEQQDPIHSSAFLRTELGPAAARRFREWKCCFASQDPKLDIPSKKTHPNFKVDEYFRHLQIIFRYAWMPGRDLSGDEQTMGFKGKHADKLRISYKKEGDGFQCDCLADDGYTFTFYFRNQPAPKKYLDSGFSALHSRCMALFDCLMEEHHQIRFDNLYMSAKFCLGAFEHPKKVMVEGVTRVHARGIPPDVIQHEVKGSKKDIAKVKGTVKAAVLENCPALASCPLVAASVYDNKGVHFLSTCATKIDWREKVRETWDKSTSTMRLGRFLRLTINDDYNNMMNNVDVADQLRGSYRPDRWMRKQKWWWSMFFWGHGTLMVNVYVSYARFMESKGMKPLTHYEFRRAIVLAKISPSRFGAAKQRLSIASQRGAQQANTRRRSKRSADEADCMSTRSDRSAKKAKPTPMLTSKQVAEDSSGFNRIRLNMSVRHLPESAQRGKGGSCCALCRYATGRKFTAQLLKCNDCNGVILCSHCFKPYHTIENIAAERDRLELEICARKGTVPTDRTTEYAKRKRSN